MARLLCDGRPSPDQDETSTAQMTLELAQEADERDVVVTARPRLEEEAAAAEVPSERQAHGEGELRPVEGMDQDISGRDGRVPPRWHFCRIVGLPVYFLSTYTTYTSLVKSHT